MKHFDRICLGIDVSKSSCRAVLLAFDPISDNPVIDLGHKSFDNSNKGFLAILKWMKSLASASDIAFSLEYTGHYSDELAHFIYKQNYTVFLHTPYKSKSFRESYDPDEKSDDRDAINLALLGLERRHKLLKWEPSDEFFYNLRIITRERTILIKQKTAIRNRLHAFSFDVGDNKETINRLNKQVDFVSKQINEVEQQIFTHLNANKEIWIKVLCLLTIPGIGIITISTVLAETNGFKKTTSAKKLAAYSGYKIRINQSGNKKSPARLSCRGNKFIRKALHMPALCMIQFNPLLKTKYEQLNARKSKPIIATTAIERKALIIMYSMYKSEKKFDKDYLKNATKMI